VIEEITAKDTIHNDGASSASSRPTRAAPCAEFRRAHDYRRHRPRRAAGVARRRMEGARSELNKNRDLTYYRGAMIDPGLDAGGHHGRYLPEKGWFWYIPLPDDLVSVGIVAEKDYLYKDTARAPVHLQREGAQQSLDRGSISRRGRQTGQYWGHRANTPTVRNIAPPTE